MCAFLLRLVSFLSGPRPITTALHLIAQDRSISNEQERVAMSDSVGAFICAWVPRSHGWRHESPSNDCSHERPRSSSMFLQIPSRTTRASSSGALWNCPCA